MKALILAGGFGTRISEETSDKPKPMVLIGDKPILWQVMTIFSVQDVNEFVIALGYKGQMIIDWFKALGGISRQINPSTCLITLDLRIQGVNKSWDVYLVDTGLETQTGGRIRQIFRLFPGEDFFVTYGDGLGNININKLVGLHQSLGLTATVTAVHPPARFGHLSIRNSRVEYFGEKRVEDLGWINGGFFILMSESVTFISDDSEPFEQNPMSRLTRSKQLAAYQHSGFWQPMDTMRDKNFLDALGFLDNPPWLSIQ